MRQDIVERKEEILQWIAEEKPLCFIKEQLQCKYETLHRYLAKLGIDYKGQQNKKGQQKGSNKRLSALEYAARRGVKSHVLKLKLLEDGLRKYECERCHNSTWNGVKIPLELHHIDGDHYNNSLDNIQILCPNCHALCENNSGKGIKRKKD